MSTTPAERCRCSASDTAAVSAVLDIPARHVRFIAADRADTTVEVLPADALKGRDVKAVEQTTIDTATASCGSRPHRRRTGSSAAPDPCEVTIQLPAGSATSPSRARRGSVKFYEAASARLTLLAGNVSVDRRDGGPAEINTPKGDIRIAEAVRGTVVPCTQADDVSGDAARGVSASLDAVTTVGLNVHATTAHGNVGIVRAHT